MLPKQALPQVALEGRKFQMGGGFVLEDKLNRAVAEDAGPIKQQDREF